MRPLIDDQEPNRTCHVSLRSHWLSLMSVFPTPSALLVAKNTGMSKTDELDHFHRGGEFACSRV